MSQLFSKKEISKILRKASEIQTQKELYGEKNGLSREELIHLAAEVGIEESSLLQALEQQYNEPFENTFNWVKGTTKIQSSELVNGEITDKKWNQIIQQIRRITGGVGKDDRKENSYEWSQRMNDIGYRHISFTQQQGKTHIQYVYKWSGIKYISAFVGFLASFVLTFLALEDAGIAKALAVSAAGLAGVAGSFLNRFFLKSFFERQKQIMEATIQSVSTIIKGTETNHIVIEANSPEELQDTTTTQSHQNRLRTS